MEQQCTSHCVTIRLAPAQLTCVPGGSLGYMHSFSSVSPGMYMKMIEKYYPKPVLFVKLRKVLPEDCRSQWVLQLGNTVPAILLLSSCKAGLQRPPDTLRLHFFDPGQIVPCTVHGPKWGPCKKVNMFPVKILRIYS